MKNYSKKNIILEKLEKQLCDLSINDNNLDFYLTKCKISKEDFYSFFPKKIDSLSKFYFEKTYTLAFKSTKAKLIREKSISKKTNLIVIAFLKSFFKNSNLSIFFINYIFFKPFLFSKIIYKIASNIWYDIGDKSIDFNYYTKRLILYNIIKSSFFYWRKDLNLEATLVFTQDQINLFGKLGKYKSIGKSRLKEKFSFILQRKNV